LTVSVVSVIAKAFFLYERQLSTREKHPKLCPIMPKVAQLCQKLPNYAKSCPILTK
jgi:hypothetical protein